LHEPQFFWGSFFIDTAVDIGYNMVIGTQILENFKEIISLFDLNPKVYSMNIMRIIFYVLCLIAIFTADHSMQNPFYYAIIFGLATLIEKK